MVNWGDMPLVFGIMAFCYSGHAVCLCFGLCVCTSPSAPLGPWRKLSKGQAVDELGNV